VLDQFPRNMFRGERAPTPPIRWPARRRARIERGFDSKVPLSERQFFYLPFEHSERSPIRSAAALVAATGDADL
jgi:uncharacterized protein (DUF924 family)